MTFLGAFKTERRIIKVPSAKGRPLLIQFTR